MRKFLVECDETLDGDSVVASIPGRAPVRLMQATAAMFIELLPEGTRVSVSPAIFDGLLSDGAEVVH